MKLKDRVAIVTGTSPNIGGGIAEGLAAEGAAIVAVDARPANANDCANYINSIGGRALGLDLRRHRRSAGQGGGRRRRCETFGRIDILVNNAAFFNKKGVLDMSFDEWKQADRRDPGRRLPVHQVRRPGDDRAREAAAPSINIISTAGHQGEPGNIAYCTAKCGLLNFTRSAAMELVGHGIRVNSLTPTATDPSESFERAARWGRTVASPKTSTGSMRAVPRAASR